MFTEGTVIYCKTQEESDAARQFLHKEGYTWPGKGDLSSTAVDPWRSEHEHGVCYCIGSRMEIRYGILHEPSVYGSPVVEMPDIMTPSTLYADFIPGG